MTGVYCPQGGCLSLFALSKYRSPPRFFLTQKPVLYPGGAFCTLILVFLSLYNSKLRVQTAGGGCISVSKVTALLLLDIDAQKLLGVPLVPVFKMFTAEQFEAN